MDRCQHCQAQLLDHLYDLLDEADQTLLEAHLSECVACRHALAVARQQQNLFAVAARLDGVASRYEAPTEVPLGEPVEQPAVLPLRHRKPARLWRPAVAAAAALLVLLGVGVYARYDHESARDTVAANQHQRNERTAELAALQRRLADVEQHRNEELERLAQREAGDELTVQATGPQVLAGRSTAPFRIETRDAQGQPVKANLRAELRHADGRETPTLVRELVREPGDGKSFRIDGVAALPPGEYDLVVHAERPGGASVMLPVPVEIAATQPMTYLTTDRPLYQAGKDVVHYRSLTLDRRTLEPVNDELNLEYVLRLPDGREEVLSRGIDRLREAGANEALLRGPDGQPMHGVGAGSFPLSANLVAGEYGLIVREGNGTFPPTRTRFLVSRPTNLRLETGPLWGRPVYRPGQLVEVSGKLVRANGEPLRGKLVTVRLLVDGQELPGGTVSPTDGEGRLHTRIGLPAQAKSTAAVLFRVQEGHATEEVQAAVPLYLPGAVVEFYPEGGDLVAGLENHVYFQARDRRGRPIALAGELLENDRSIGVRVRTAEVPEVGASSGLGSFRFTPKAGMRYHLRVDSPTETGRLPLPAVHDEGVVLTVHETVVEAGQPLTVRVRSTASRPVRVALSCRGEVLEVVTLAQGQGEARFATRAARGVCRVTAYEEHSVLGHQAPGEPLLAGLVGRTDEPLAVATLLLAGSERHLEMVPRAERLAFCRPQERLDLEVKTEKASQADGKLAKLTLQARDEFRRSVPAVVQLGVIDHLALAEADDRFVRSLPAHAWLAAELPAPELLERADALLLPAAASRQALDLVLATQGWRRFEGTGESGDTDRLITVQARRLPDYAALAREQSALLATTTEQQAALAEREAEVSDALAGLSADEHAVAAAQRLAWYQEQGQALQRGFLLALGGVLAVLLILALVRVAQAELEWARTSLALAGGCAALLIVALLTPSLVPLDLYVPDLPVAVAKPGEQQLALARQKAPERRQTSWDLRRLGGELARKEIKEAPGGFDKARAHAGPLGGNAAGNPPALLENKAGFGGQPDTAAADTVQPNKAVPAAPMALMQTWPEVEKPQEDATARFHRQLVEELRKEENERGKESGLPAGQGIEADRAERKRPLVVRTFANFKNKATESSRDRAPVVFWHPVLVLPGQGTTVEFQLGNPTTLYRIDIQAHSLDGRLGTLRQDLRTNTEK